MTVLYTILIAVIGVTLLLAVHRSVVGPTILDRVVASDLTVGCVVAVCAVYTFATGTAYAIPLMVAIATLAFAGSVAVARFVPREDRRDAPEDPEVLQGGITSLERRMEDIDVRERFAIGPGGLEDLKDRELTAGEVPDADGPFGRGTDERTDGRADGRTVGRTVGRTEEGER